MGEISIGTRLWKMPRDRRNDWEPHFVIGQTSASWIVHPQTDGAPTDWSAVKVIKATMRTAASQSSKNGWGPPSWCDDEERGQIRWLGRNHRDITKAVERCDDVEKLRKIAEIVGFAAEDPTHG